MHSSRHLAEHGFHDIQPRAMLWREDELEPLRMKAKVLFSLLGYVGRVVVEQQANPCLRWILGIEFSQ